MTMRRADFKAIADEIRKYKLSDDMDFEAFVHNLCNVFRQSNPTFDKGKFLKACGYYQE